MKFTSLNKQEKSQLNELKLWRKTVARAELTKMLSEVRLDINDEAVREIENDSWFRDQEKAVQVAIRTVVAAEKAEELERLSGALSILPLGSDKVESLGMQFKLKGLEEQS